MVDLTDKALDVIDNTLDCSCERKIKLRAAIAILQSSGIGRATSNRITREAIDQAAEGGE